MTELGEDRGPRVVALVEWVDSSMIADAWVDRQETVDDAARYLTSIRSAGLLLEQADEYIVLVGSYGPALDQVAEVVVIPRVAIRRLDVWHRETDGTP